MKLISPARTIAAHHPVGSATRSRRADDVGFALSDFLVIVLVLGLRTRGGVFATAAYLVLVVSALWSPLSSIKALSLSWLITMINPGIAAASNAAEAMRWLVIAAVAVRAVFASFRMRTGGIPISIVALSGFVLAAFIGSLIASYSQEVSVLKLLLFFAGGFGILVTFHQALDQHLEVGRWLGTLTATIAILSLPLIFQDIGYLQNGRGFQGILNHPQAYGVFLALALVHLGNDVLIQRRRSTFLTAGFVIALASLPATEARTGVVAVVSGFLVTCILGALINRQMLRRVFRGLLSTKSILAVHGLIVVLLFSIGGIRRMIEDFLFKHSQQSSLSDVFQESRGFMAERSFENILAHPVMGIGFGISSDPASLEIHRDPVLSLPIGAPVEKGLLPLAVLEETGAIGFVFFLLLIAALLVPIASHGRFGLLWIACTCLAVNIGESIFLSFGAMGLYQWLILAFAVTRPTTLKTSGHSVPAISRHIRWMSPRLVATRSTPARQLTT